MRAENQELRLHRRCGRVCLLAQALRSCGLPLLCLSPPFPTVTVGAGWAGPWFEYAICVFAGAVAAWLRPPSPLFWTRPIYLVRLLQGKYGFGC